VEHCPSSDLYSSVTSLTQQCSAIETQGTWTSDSTLEELSKAINGLRPGKPPRAQWGFCWNSTHSLYSSMVYNCLAIFRMQNPKWVWPAKNTHNFSFKGLWFKSGKVKFFYIIKFWLADKTQLLANFSKICSWGSYLKVLKIFENYNVFTNYWAFFWYHDCSINCIVKSGFIDPSKSKSWKVLETCTP